MLELDDIQGLVVRGYGALPHASYLLAAIEDRGRARAWLATLAGRLDDARERPGALAVNVAFTRTGLAALGVPAPTLERFPLPFVVGMTDPHRSRLLGDVEESAPEHWDWGGPQSAPVDVLLLVYASDARELGRATEELRGAAGIRVVGELDTAELQPREHFGFRDGISQPRIEGLGEGPAANTIKAGEFVLGYRNEYGLLPDAPPGALGRNGSFLVLRQLSQDVHGFWDFCERASARADGTVDEAARLRLAAKLVGRWPGGAPLALAPDADAPELADANDFGYFHGDRHGLGCPVGAHVRRAHPRDSLDPDPGSQRSIDVGKRHRLLRRGRQYGRFLAPEVLLTAGVDEAWLQEPRGLHFVCLGTNLSRQFEFVQHTWIANPRFAGLHDDPDPLLGPAGSTFTVPARPVRDRYTGLPRFVSVHGGAYFLLPGIRAVRELAAAG